MSAMSRHTISSESKGAAAPVFSWRIKGNRVKTLIKAALTSKKKKK